jgi:hypothetical protein
LSTSFSVRRDLAVGRPHPGPKRRQRFRKAARKFSRKVKIHSGKKADEAIADTISGYHGDEDVDVDLQGSNVA